MVSSIDGTMDDAMDYATVSSIDSAMDDAMDYATTSSMSSVMGDAMVPFMDGSMVPWCRP